MKQFFNQIRYHNVCQNFKLWQTFFLVFLSFPASAQVIFKAELDATQVEVGEVFQLGFTLQNAQLNTVALKLPSFADFKLLAGPNRMTNSTIVNGSATTKEAVYYSLQALREGTFTIGAARLEVGGKTLTTTPLSISVVKGKRTTGSSGKPNGNDVSIRADISASEAYVGQQIVLDYKLFTRVNINGMSRLSESDYDGFFHLEINDYPRADRRVTIGGKPFFERTLQRYALFPQREGSLSISPLAMQVGIVQKDKSGNYDDPFGRFFSSVQTENRNIEANALKILVKPLPSGAPPSFTGAVGNFKAAFSMPKTDGTTDDVLTLHAVFIGNGDPKRWQLPKLLLPSGGGGDGLEFYDPKILKEQNLETEGEWKTLREVEYLIVPKRVGDFTFKPEFSYFDTEGSVFKTIDTIFSLKIQQGSNKPAVVAADKPADIRGIKTATVFVSSSQPFFGSLWFWLLLALPFVAFGGVVLLKNWQLRQSRRDIALVKRENAPRVAEQRLAVAAEFLKKGNRKVFYEEVSKALFNYVSDKFGLPLADFSKSNVQKRLKALNINDLHIENFVQTLNDCELALFAGRDTEGSASAVYSQAERVITDIEDDLK